MKKKVTITISGPANSCKTALMQEIISMLKFNNIEVEAVWGSNSPKSNNLHERSLLKAKEVVKVVINEEQRRKDP